MRYCRFAILKAFYGCCTKIKCHNTFKKYVLNPWMKSEKIERWSNFTCRVLSEKSTHFCILWYYYSNFPILGFFMENRDRLHIKMLFDIIRYYRNDHLTNSFFFFFLSNDSHILQRTCITNKNITKNTIWKAKQHKH